MKKTLTLLLALTFVIGMIGAAAADDALGVVSVCAIAETLQEGQTVTGVRIEYPGEIEAGTVARSIFSVTGYDIIGLYVNTTGEVGRAEAKGQYLFLKFAYSTVPGYSFGKTLQYIGGANLRRDTYLDIRQNANIELMDGGIVAAAAFSNDGEINVLADEFLPITFTNPEDGSILNYRLYIPEGYETRQEGIDNLPLVVFLHGGGEGGENNIAQILGNPSALEFATDEAQSKNPCFVLAPQKPPTSRGWAENTGTEEAPFYATSVALENVKLVVDELLAAYNIDNTRLYCTGLSMGSRGTLALNITYPDIFAAMLCIASADIYTDEQTAGIADKPIWMLLAADETEERLTNTSTLVDQLEALGASVLRRVGEEAWDGYARGYAANLLAQEQLDAAASAGATILFTHYLPGTVIPQSHWSWMATYNNEVIRDWLFAQRLEAGYEPGE